MIRRQTLVVMNLILILVLVVADESRAQYGGYDVGYGSPICCGPASYSPGYYQPCSPMSRGFRVRGERAWRGCYRSSSVVYDYSPSQVYIDATTYRRFGPVPPPQFVVKPPVKEPSVAKVQRPAKPESGVVQPESVAPDTSRTEGPDHDRENTGQREHAVGVGQSRSVAGRSQGRWSVHDLGDPTMQRLPSSRQISSSSSRPIRHGFAKWFCIM